MSSYPEASLLPSDSRPTAKIGCPDQHKGVVERHMLAMPSSHRKTPVSGEVFKDLNSFEARMRDWSFCEGFEISTSGGGSASTPGLRLVCKHHGSATRNSRGLLRSNLSTNDEAKSLAKTAKRNRGAAKSQTKSLS